MITRSLLLFISILIGGGLLLWLGLTLTNNNSMEGLSTIQKKLSDNELLFTVFRIGLIFTIYHYWENFCKWCGNYKNLDDDTVNLLIGSTNNAIMWFVVIELVINQNVFGLIFNKIL